MRFNLKYIKQLQGQQSEMSSLLEEWVNINSGSDNIDGLKKMFSVLQNCFTQLGCKVESIHLPARQQIDNQGNLIDLPVGNALKIIQRPELSRRVFLGGHMDTVFPKEGSFQKAVRHSKNRMGGPGAADMKGGLIVMLKALEAFEKSPLSENLGWNLVIDADEEVGSKSSEELILKCAKPCQFGLIFEPAYSDGNLVSARKGSANYSVVAHGKASHAGRDFHAGRSAIFALARFAMGVELLNGTCGESTFNIGNISGGGPVNIVPDLAICRLNVRYNDIKEQAMANQLLKDLVAEINQSTGLELTLFESSSRSPKPFDGDTEHLFKNLKMCGDQLSMDLKWRPSGGVCDGNILSMAGVPCIDSLGVVGGELHTHDEYAELESLPQRAMLTALLLLRYAAAEFQI